jgi:molybdopterin-containing oxidoreductase family iron-sulfur binding subunit
MVKRNGKVAETGVNAYPLFDGYNTVVSGVTIEKRLMTTNLQVLLQNTMML